MNVFERRSFTVRSVPTLDDHVVNLPGTHHRLRQEHLLPVVTVEMSGVGYNLVVVEIVEGLVAGERQDLPQCDSE